MKFWGKILRPICNEVNGYHPYRNIDYPIAAITTPLVNDELLIGKLRI